MQAAAESSERFSGAKRVQIEGIAILLLIAAVVAMLARRVRLPYTVGLVLTGTVLAFSRFVPPLALTKELIFTAFLPPLVFEAAIHLSWRGLRRDLLLISTLATLGIVLAAAVVAGGMCLLLGWDMKYALLFGVLISATDPVSVIATFKETAVEGRLKLLVEAESLFNDGTAAVAFGVMLAMIGGERLGVLQTGLHFLWTVLGGIGCGLLVAGGVMSLAGQTEDHLVEITLTSVAAYGSFLLAEHFHLSGVLATVAAGLLIAQSGHHGRLTERGNDFLVDFWEYVAFVVNSLIFLLLGIQQARENFGTVAMPAGIAIVLVLAGRAAAVYGCCALFLRSRQRVSLWYQHILVWGGLRGALSLALALGLPNDPPIYRLIRTLAFAVVAFSVIVQGLTITPLLRRAGTIEEGGT